MRVGVVILILCLSSLARAQAGAPTVRRIETRADDGADWAFAPPGAVRLPPVVAADDVLRVARSRDGSALWVARTYDDGTTTVLAFSLEPAARASHELLYVDGVDRERLDVWVVDTAATRAFRPSDPDQSLPLVGLGARPLIARTPWALRSSSCPEAGGSPCIYYGAPRALCGAFSRLSDEDVDRVDVAPRACH